MSGGRRAIAGVAAAPPVDFDGLVTQKDSVAGQTYFYDVKVDTDNSIYCCGGTRVGAASEGYVIVQKYDTSLNLVASTTWFSTVPDFALGTGYSLSIASDGIYVFSTVRDTNRHNCISKHSKTDLSRIEEWGISLTDSYTYGGAIDSGGRPVCAITTSTISGSGILLTGPASLTGAPVRSQDLWNGVSMYLRGVTTYTGDEVLVCGRNHTDGYATVAKVNTATGALGDYIEAKWTASTNGYELRDVIASGANIVAFGNISSNAGVFVYPENLSSITTMQRYSGLGVSEFYAAKEANGSYYVAGVTQLGTPSQSRDKIFVGRINQATLAIDAYSCFYTSGEHCWASGIGADSNGDIYVAGCINGGGQFEQPGNVTGKAVLLKLTPALDLIAIAPACQADIALTTDLDLTGAPVPTEINATTRTLTTRSDSEATFTLNDAARTLNQEGPCAWN